MERGQKVSNQVKNRTVHRMRTFHRVQLYGTVASPVDLSLEFVQRNIRQVL